jgi:hypothetical protein
MPRVPFKYCALHYLDQWLAHDRKYHDALTGVDEAQTLRSLQEAAAFYRVSRNLWEKHDVGKGLPRFGPVLSVLDAEEPADFQGERLIPAISRVRKQLSDQYGNRDVLSLTTKFLWLKIKSPIIIYDSRARTALGIREGNIDAYYRRWRQAFDEHAAQIELACDSLQHVLDFSVNPQLATASYVSDLASQRWFRDRVLYIYLWHLGGD